MQTARPYVNREAERVGPVIRAYALTWGLTPVFSRTGVPHFHRFDRHAFDEQLEFCHTAQTYRGIQCLYNHGTDEDGRPADAFSSPLGEIVEITTDDTGLLTRVAYADSVLADETLRWLLRGEITAQSMTAAIYDPIDHDTAVSEYDVVTIHKARLKEFGPNLDPHDPGAKILDIAGLKPRRQATWITELETLLDKAETLEQRARVITGEIDAMLAWEKRTRNQRRQHAPRLAITGGMTSGARWAARGEAEREARRLNDRAQQLLAEYGYQWRSA
jgi:hypothetical protein